MLNNRYYLKGDMGIYDITMKIKYINDGCVWARKFTYANRYEFTTHILGTWVDEMKGF